MVFAALVAMALAPLQAAEEVPFRIGDDAIIVDTTINGRKTSLMFDTGFSGEVVLNDAINIGPPSGKLNLKDFVGTFEATTVKIKTLKIGTHSVSLKDMDAVQQPMMHLSFSYDTHTDGILGYGAMAGELLEINFEKSKFVFHPKTLDITKRVPDNQRTFLSKMLPIGRNTIEMEVRTAEGKRIVLALDTGNAFYATTHREVLERVGLWDKSRPPNFVKSSYVASGPVDSWYKKMPALTIFGVPVAESFWDIIELPSSSSEGDGTVGFGFLKNFNIILDYDRRRVWLERFTDRVENTPAGGVGLSVAMRPDGTRAQVVRIAPNGPADKSGIARGDGLLSIDGKELVGLTHRDLDKLMEGEVGSKVNLVTSRDGQIRRLELERVPLVND